VAQPPSHLSLHIKPQDLSLILRSLKSYHNQLMMLQERHPNHFTEDADEALILYNLLTSIQECHTVSPLTPHQPSGALTWNRNNTST
jgi:hypothetical protein